MVTGQAGPIFRFQYGRLVPFAHALGGGAHIGGPASQSCTWGWAATGGVGLDYILPGLGNHVALRPVQADFHYSQVSYGPLLLPAAVTGGFGEIYAYRLSAGLVARFGDLQPDYSPVLGCTTQPSTVFAGDPITVNGTSLNLKGNHRYRYLWLSTGGRVTGTESTATINTANLAPGDYSVSGKVVNEKNAKEIASCRTTFTVRTYEPPTISCSVAPQSLVAGGQASSRRRHEPAKPPALLLLPDHRRPHHQQRLHRYAPCRRSQSRPGHRHLQSNRRSRQDRHRDHHRHHHRARRGRRAAGPASLRPLLRPRPRPSRPRRQRGQGLPG